MALDIFESLSRLSGSSSLAILISTTVALLIILFFHWLKNDTIPIINKYKGDIFSKKAHAEYLTNSEKLISDGVARYNGPFRVITTLGSRVILPAKLANWVKNCKDLDHVQLVADEYFAGYPGFDGNGAVVNPDRMLIEVTKAKLNQSSQCELFHRYLSELLEQEWADKNDNWRPVPWGQDVARYVGRMSSAVFVGPDLARDPEWQALILSYTVNLFNGVRALRTWPAFTRSFIHWVLPECRTCRKQLVLARGLLQPIMDKRRRTAFELKAAGQDSPSYNDTVAWVEEVAAGRPYDPAATQLGFAIAAMHTTTELLKQTLVDICFHPELIQPLRDEAEAAVGQHGWTTAGLFQMQLMDSVIKETQRMKPGSLVNLERKATRDVAMPDGTVLPRGTNVAVDTAGMWDPEIFKDPRKYDGYRFYNLRKDGGAASNTAQLVSVSNDFIAFGLGRSVCPGRFMVANEIKAALATILLRYDVRLADGQRPRVVHYGFEMLSDPTTVLEVRRRA
ncbi:cytochrome P450 [Colletotrichum higginsianum]|uniref:Cytochrome P450 n=2 Tax=Colletotrichum higginsianum TaxID=80884 RepID=H1VQ57_COLHI|nr:Cytochrome P450 [Colletotrichum higginsianum IMI 349063]OBR07272.1 Cytochrome P450 [Colletotrichum higginsianum IMI 349063]TIC92641.1 Cytochrome P450 monooxygenase pyr3 [Colletotrichum higginsianum]CCF42363.1 cytochrome P450 [Colletotrichum higginsianum]